jgi:putative copper export protein
MTLIPIWLHVLGVITWLGGLAWQAHVLAPLARRGELRLFAAATRRARPVTWTAVAVVALTGFYNVTTLGSLEQVMQSGAGLALAGKFMLVLGAVALAAQRDFAHVPRLMRAVAGAEDPAPVLRAIAWLDRLVLGLAFIIVYLGLYVSRGGLTAP